MKQFILFYLYIFKFTLYSMLYDSEYFRDAFSFSYDLSWLLLNVFSLFALRKSLIHCDKINIVQGSHSKLIWYESSHIIMIYYIKMMLLLSTLQFRKISYVELGWYTFYYNVVKNRNTLSAHVFTLCDIFKIFSCVATICNFMSCWQSRDNK